MYYYPTYVHVEAHLICAASIPSVKSSVVVVTLEAHLKVVAAGNSSFKPEEGKDIVERRRLPIASRDCIFCNY